MTAGAGPSKGSVSLNPIRPSSHRLGAGVLPLASHFGRVGRVMPWAWAAPVAESTWEESPPYFRLIRARN